MSVFVEFLCNKILPKKGGERDVTEERTIYVLKRHLTSHVK